MIDQNVLAKIIVRRFRLLHAHKAISVRYCASDAPAWIAGY